MPCVVKCMLHKLQHPLSSPVDVQEPKGKKTVPVSSKSKPECYFPLVHYLAPSVVNLGAEPRWLIMRMGNLSTCLFHPSSKQL
eukprot:scaffold274680_cov46-Prasinocladus_malaysianus.AAC.3